MIRPYRFALPLALAAFCSLGSPVLLAETSDAHTHSQPTGAITAQTARESASARTLELLSLHKRWLKAPASERAQLHQQLLAKAEQRRQLLDDLMQSHPAELLRAAIPEEQQQGMPAEVLEFVEQKLELEGEFEAVYEDYEDGTHKLRQFLKTPFGERFELHFAKSDGELSSGAKIQVYGVYFTGVSENKSLDGSIILDSKQDSVLTLAADGSTSGGSNGGTPSAGAYTLGEQKTLVILVNFQDQPNNRPWALNDIHDLVFGDVNDFYLENSFGQSWLTGDVAGWYTLPIDSVSCDENGISTSARAAAASAGINVTGYNRYVYIFPRNACGWGGLGTVGGSQTHAWINGTPSLYYIGHEMGHNFGLHHARALECSEGVLEGSCNDRAYGDTIDIMGSPQEGHFNAFQKDRLGWFNEGAATLTTIETSGSYNLGSFEFAAPGNPTALKVLKEQDSTTGKKTWYYVEYRQAAGFDNFLTDNSNVLNGLVIHRGSELSKDSSYLLDMTPGSSRYLDLYDPALEVGNSFTDTQAGVSLTTQWTDGNQATLDVIIGTQSCVATAPTLALVPNESQWGEPGSTVNYSLTLTNNNSISCSGSDYNLSTVVPNGWLSHFTQDHISLNPGNSVTIDLAVTSTSSSVDGYYDIQITAVSGTTTDSVSATYVVSAPASNSAPIANNDNGSTDANTLVTLDVLANDSDPDGDNLIITNIIQGTGGNVNLNSDGTLAYTPNSGYSGTDSFEYTISDGQGANDSATVTVSVTAVASNQPPIAVDDNAATTEELAVVIAVLANDSDPDNDGLELVSATQGTNGAVKVNADGTLSYTPHRRFKGNDSFTYAITDGHETVEARVDVSVAGKQTGNGNSKGGGKS